MVCSPRNKRSSLALASAHDSKLLECSHGLHEEFAVIGSTWLFVYQRVFSYEKGVHVLLRYNKIVLPKAAFIINM